MFCSFLVAFSFKDSFEASIGFKFIPASGRIFAFCWLFFPFAVSFISTGIVLKSLGFGRVFCFFLVVFSS